MHVLLIILLLLVLILGPQWWARYTFRRYAGVLERIPGTGGELARHLLDRSGMPDVGVEKTEQGGDHYDPEHRVVRLSLRVFAYLLTIRQRLISKLKRQRLNWMKPLS